MAQGDYCRVESKPRTYSTGWRACLLDFFFTLLPVGQLIEAPTLILRYQRHGQQIRTIDQQK